MDVKSNSANFTTTFIFLEGELKDPLVESTNGEVTDGDKIENVKVGGEAGPEEPEVNPING